MSKREEFEIQQEVELYDWCAANNGNISVGDAWHEAASRQQKKIDALEADNPQVECPVCGGKKGHSEQKRYPDDNSGVVGFYGNPAMTWIQCKNCKGTGTVPLTKAQEYRIKDLEKQVEFYKTAAEKYLEMIR